MCVDHRLVEQPLVSLLQRRQQHVPIDVPRQPFQVRHHPIDQLRLVATRCGQQPAQTETIPFFPAEGDRSVQRLVAQNVEAAFHASS